METVDQDIKDVQPEKNIHNTSFKLSSPYGIFSLLIVFILLIGIIIGAQLIKDSQDLRGRAAPTTTVQQPDAGQVPTEDQIREAQETIADDSGLESIILKVKGITTQPSTDVKGATLPVVTIESPADASTLPVYAAVKITASASHPSGIRSILIYVNDIPILTTCKTSPCTVWRGFAQSPVGSYKIKAIAYSNETPPYSAETSITVYKQVGTATISNVMPSNTPVLPTGTQPIATPTYAPDQNDRIPPTISVSRPSDNQVLYTDQSGVRVDATAQDTSGVSRMEIYLLNSAQPNGGKLIASSPNPSIGAYPLSSSFVPGASNTIQIKAYDKATPIANITTTARTIIKSSSRSTIIPGQLTNTPFPTARITNYPTLPPPTTPTITSPASSQYPRIAGTAQYISRIQQAIDQMRTKGPSYYGATMQYVVGIQQCTSGCTRANVGTKIIYLADVNVSGNTEWTGSTIIHEAYHIKNYYEGNPWFGCEGEKWSLRPQAAYLRLLGQTSSAQYVEAQIGVWQCSPTPTTPR